MQAKEELYVFYVLLAGKQESKRKCIPVILIKTWKFQTFSVLVRILMPST